MSKDAIIEKIKKLLRMKRGGTRSEVETALALAAELARKHGIDLALVNPDEETSRIKHVTDALKSRLPLEAKYSAGICVNFFNVNVVVSQRPHPQRPWELQWLVNFIGTDWDIEIARFIFGFLQGHFRRSWAQRENRRLKNRAAFLDGMFLGLSYKLDEERRSAVQENAMVFIGRALQIRDDYVKLTWPNTKSSNLKVDKSNADAARMAGINAGMETNIRKGLNKTSAPQRPQLPPAAGQMALL